MLVFPLGMDPAFTLLPGHEVPTAWAEEWFNGTSSSPVNLPGADHELWHTETENLDLLRRHHAGVVES
jgi:hypothetical protein